MLPVGQVQSTLAFCAVAYILHSILFPGKEHNPIKRRRALLISVVIFIAGLAIKTSTDASLLPTNYYSLLEVERHSSTLDIRRSYKNLSKKYHPDKNPTAEAEDIFQTVKAARDILMDENTRDVYNRFGADAIAFDPRKDELKLITDVSMKYLFYIVVFYILTLPKSTRAARSWLAILGIALLGLEVSFTMTGTSLPDSTSPENSVYFMLLSKTLTEHELLHYLHGSFPAIAAILVALASSYYVDTDLASIAVLQDVFKQQQLISQLLQQLELLVEKSRAEESNGGGQEIRAKINVIRDFIEDNSDKFSARIDYLRSSSSNPGANYYWIIYVLIYGGIYFLQ